MYSGLDYKADTSRYIFALKLNTLENDSKRTLFYHIMSDDIL